MKSDTNIDLLASPLSGAGTVPGILVKPTALPLFLSQPIKAQSEQASLIPSLFWQAHQVLGDA